MASQTVPQVRPQVVPFPAPITQPALARILELRQEIERLEAEVHAAENVVRQQLESGDPVEPGIFRAYLKITERRSVAWKAVCERELGEDYCKRVLAATRPETFTHLVVEA